MNSRLVPALVTNRLLGIGWAIFLALLFVLAFDSFITTPGGDSAIYLYVAQGIPEGEIPYLDRWDNKGPLFYVLNLIGLVIDETWGIWVVQGLFLLGAASLAFLLLWRTLGVLPALFALAVFLAYYKRFAPPGNYTEQYGLLFQFSHPIPLRPQPKASLFRTFPGTIRLAALEHWRARCRLLPS